MNNTVRERIMHNLATVIANNAEIHGVIDDTPDAEEYMTPPRPPRAEWGEPALPFAFVYESDEEVTTGSTAAYNNRLRARVEVSYNFGRDGSLRFKPLGRYLLGEVQRAVMADLSRGGLAYDTLETGNSIEPGPDDGHGVAIVDFDIRYWRNLADPTSREARAVG